MNLDNQFTVAGQMPELPHSQGNDEWSAPGESAAVDWLCAQPQIRAAVFFLARNYGLIGPASMEARTWRGSPEMRAFVPYSEEEIRGELEKPRRLMQLHWALLEKYERPADQWGLRLGMIALVKRGVVVMKELPGYRGRVDKWYGLREEDFAKADVKAATARAKPRLRVENILDVLVNEGPITSHNLVAGLPEFSRSTVYSKLAKAKEAGLVELTTDGAWVASQKGKELVKPRAETEPDAHGDAEPQAAPEAQGSP